MARLDNLDYEVNGVTTNYEIVPEIAPLFNATTAYAAGDTVIEEGHLYRFNTAHAPGAWIGTDADEITVGEELTSHGADITELKNDFTQLDGKIDASLITNTASGAIASFPDGADNVPVKDLVVDIEPVQDLHGQANPYPAGSRKNKFPNAVPGDYSAENINATVSDNGVITIKCTTSASISLHLVDTFALSSGQKIIIDGNFHGTVYFYNGSTRVDYFSYSGNRRVLSGEEVSSLVGATVDTIKFLQTSVNTSETVTIMAVESDVSDYSYAPYSNICPISGWTGANIVRTGVNLWGGTDLANNVRDNVSGATIDTTNKTVSFAYNATGSNGIAKLPYKENTRYTFMLAVKNDTIERTNLRIVYADGTYSQFEFLSSYVKGTKAVIVLTSTSGKTVERIGKNSQGGTTVLYYDECGVFEGVLTESDFVPYKGTTVNVDWATEAGTVYGGTLDVTTGVLTVDWGKFVASSSSLRRNDGNRWYIPNTYTGSVIPASDNADKVISNVFKSVTGSSYSDQCWINNTGSIRFNTSKEYESISALLEAIPVIEFAYELAEPQTYQLTPTEVSTLLGLNNIWADTGDVSVDYRADTKLYIENLTAPTEDDMVANTNIPNATYFMVGNTLYLSTTTIPAGDTINPGTNCTKMDLAAALNAINA